MSPIRRMAIALAMTVAALGAFTGTSGAASVKLTSACIKINSQHLKASPGFEPLTRTQVAEATKYCRQARLSANKLRWLDNHQWLLNKHHAKQPCWQIPNLRETVKTCMTARRTLREQTRRLVSFNSKASELLLPKIAKPLLPPFTCIHRHEAAWNDRGDPYWGGLQMDRKFEAAYGRDMVIKHGGRIAYSHGVAIAEGGNADQWKPKEQIVVAIRAYLVRGFAPWPNTRLACHLPLRL